MHDLSGRIASEHALREAKHVAEAANRAKGDFLAAFSHEIRTPLNVVVGLTSHILEGTPDPDTRHSVERVQANAKILMGLLNNVLDLSKIEAQQMELLHASFDLIDHIESLVDAQSGQVLGSTVELSLHIDPNVPHHVRGDQVRLGQILTNLLGNAVKFTKQGEVSVTVRCTETTQDRAAIEFEVRDTGVGISAEDQRHLFERFFQVEGERRIAAALASGSTSHLRWPDEWRHPRRIERTRKRVRLHVAGKLRARRRPPPMAKHLRFGCVRKPAGGRANEPGRSSPGNGHEGRALRPRDRPRTPTRDDLRGRWPPVASRGRLRDLDSRIRNVGSPRAWPKAPTAGRRRCDP